MNEELFESIGRRKSCQKFREEELRAEDMDGLAASRISSLFLGEISSATLKPRSRLMSLATFAAFLPMKESETAVPSRSTRFASMCQCRRFRLWSVRSCW